jgi:ketosteroid isomerase-like protein
MEVVLSENATQVGARETVERFFGLLGAGDPDRLAGAFTEDVDWYVPGHAEVPWTGPRTRRDQIPEYFKLLVGCQVNGTTSELVLP